MRVAAAWLPIVATACAAPSSIRTHEVAGADVASGADETSVATFEREEEDAIRWMAAADPRLASRVAEPGRSVLTAEVLKRIGMEAIFAEDGAAEIRGGSLDLFAFRARAKALDQAARRVGASPESLPEAQPAPAATARPKLERELLARVIQEEQSRVAEEAQLGDASGDLIRAIVATWSAPSGPEEWNARDAWVSKHLLEMRASLRQSAPRTGPPDLDVALYPLERLLTPLEFPRGAAAIAELRVGLDEDMRRVPPLVARDRLAREAKAHLGVAVDPESLPARFDAIATRLAELASAEMAADRVPRSVLEARARELLLVEDSCPAVAATRVRAMGPPPERAAICGALRALTEEPSPAAALLALHDDVLLADAALTTAPPPRTALLSHPDDDVVDALRRMARERPIVVVGVALAAELLYGTDGSEARLRAWRALGEAPLDVVARELGSL